MVRTGESDEDGEPPVGCGEGSEPASGSSGMPAKAR